MGSGQIYLKIKVQSHFTIRHCYLLSKRFFSTCLVVSEHKNTYEFILFSQQPYEVEPLLLTSVYRWIDRQRHPELDQVSQCWAPDERFQPLQSQAAVLVSDLCTERMCLQINTSASSPAAGPWGLPDHSCSEAARCPGCSARPASPLLPSCLLLQAVLRFPDETPGPVAVPVEPQS